MTERSRLLGLMARRDSAELARIKAEMVRLVRTRAEIEGLIGRLQTLLEERSRPGPAPVLAADFRLNRQLCGDIAAEGIRQRDRIVALEQEVAQVQAELARKDHRRQKLEEAHRSALVAEAEEREAKAAAALPPRVRH